MKFFADADSPRGLVANTDEEYHASDGVSKSFLWDIETITPYAARFRKRESKPAFVIGKAAHIAILEPDRLETACHRGPADRRGNKWKEAQDFAEACNALLLTESDYDLALMIRDVAQTVPELRLMREADENGDRPIVETSAYAVDEETGLLIRTRPDMYSRKHKLIVDLKNMADASKDAWEKAVGSFGYHVQDAFYTDTWEKGSGLEVEGFWFAVFEKGDPPQVALYEMDAATAAEGYARYRRGLARIAEYARADRWPSYPESIQKASLRRWDYEINPAPDGQL